MKRTLRVPGSLFAFPAFLPLQRRIQSPGLLTSGLDRFTGGRAGASSSFGFQYAEIGNCRSEWVRIMSESKDGDQRVTVRRADVSDITAVESIAHSLHLENTALSDRGFLVHLWSADEYRKFLRSGDCLAVCTRRASVVGFALAFASNKKLGMFATWTHAVEWTALPLPPTRGVLLDQVAVAPEHHRQRVGSSLVKYVRSRFLSFKLYAEVLISPIENTVSMDFHRSLGFTPAGRRLDNDYLWEVLRG